jgi:putative selenium metabolism protein SsnA
MALVLKGGTVASFAGPRVEKTSLGIEDGRIAWVGEDVPPGEHEIVDCSGTLVMPGNVCAHTHLYSALARGMPPPPRQPRNFPEILELIWWRLDRALDDETIRLSALSGAADALLSGTTTLVDHHASPNAIAGSLDVMGEALEEIGIRSVLCYEVTDRNGPDGAAAGLRENERFVRKNRRPRTRGMIGAHASFTLEDATLRSLSEVAEDLNLGVHIHVAEDVCDEDDSMRRSGMRPAFRLQKAGVFQPGSIAAHGVHLNEAEIDAARAAKVWFAHNCRSNLNNGVGRAPIAKFGNRSVMGTDGIDGDMFAESRTAFFRAREESLDHGADELTAMLARGADMVSQMFERVIGRIEVGAAADLMLLEYPEPTPLEGGNLPWHWTFAFSSRMVRSVMVDGDWVVRDRALVKIDEERMRASARSAAPKLWERMGTL